MAWGLRLAHIAGMWSRVPVVVKVALAWMPFFVVWVLFILTYAESATLTEAILSSSFTIAGAALLGVPVWWLAGRFPWPERVHLPFYLLHFVFGSVYAFTWLSIGYVMAAAGNEARAFDLIRNSPVLGWQYLTGLWLYGFVAGTSYALRTREQLQHQERVAARAEAVAAQARLRALRSQLNPHFLFNALHSLSVLIQDSPKDASRAVDRLGELLRYALDENTGDRVMLSEEWDFTKAYLDVEAIRFGDRLKIVADLDEDALARAVPPFSVQPLVENAVRHGIALKPVGGTIRITARVEGDTLVVTVSDDGAGANDFSERSYGHGLRSLQQRLEVAYGRDGATLRTETTLHAGFHVVLTLPSGIASNDGSLDDLSGAFG